MESSTGCPYCGQTNSVEQRFCGSCGGSLVKSCAACGTENRAGFRFCGSCGQELGPTASPGPTPAATAGTATGAAAARQPREERRWATVLFVDVSGFTAAAEHMDPEDVTAMIDPCLRRLGEIVEEFDGYVEKIVGDQVMALFGAPVAHEDDPERAVRAGLEMQRCAREQSAKFGGLKIRVGINTGEVMFAPVGPDSARRFTAMGDSVNTASRLETAAPLGGVLVGEATYKATRRAFRYEEVEPFRAKNKQEIVKAWLAVEPLGRPGERVGSATPLVGREKELALLTSLWERVMQEGRAHLVTLLGPPGIGKTRLAQELIERAKSDAADVVRGRSLPYGAATGYDSFAQQVRQVAGIFESDDADAAAAKLQETVDALLPTDDAADVGAHLALLLGIGGDAPADKPAIFFSARRFVEALTQRSPSIFLFEDIHWSDPTLLDLIESLASKARQAPVLFLCLARPEIYDVRPNWGGGLPAFTALPLEPLSAGDSAVLAAKIGSRTADPDTNYGDHSDDIRGHTAGTESHPDLARLAEIAEGNPLFIEELVSSLAERAGDRSGDLPTTVRGIIAARLDALPDKARSVLLDASVVGKVFWRGAIERLSGDANSIARAREGLDYLEDRDFVRRSSVSRLQGDEEFTFRHMLTREVAYATIPKAARRERHAVVAGFLEETAGEGAGAAAPMLAHHYREAGDEAKAVSYLVMAAERAGRAWARGEAVALLREALALTSDGDVESRLDLRLRIASLLVESGDYPAAVQELGPLLPELEGTRRIQGHLAFARAAFWLSDASTARLHSDAALELVDAIGAADLRPPALGVAVLVSSMAGRLAEGLQRGRDALADWIPGTRPVELAGVVSLVGVMYYWAGDNENGAEFSRQGWEGGIEVHSLDSALQAGPAYATSLCGMGRYREAFDVFRDVVDLGREYELAPRMTGRALSMWGGAIRDLYDASESRAMGEEALELARRSGFPNTLVQTATDFLLLDLLVGDIGKAQANLPLVFESASALRGWHEWLVGGRLADFTAQLHLAMENYDDAVLAATDSIERASTVGRLKYEASGRRLLAEALLGARQPDAAASEAARAFEIANRVGNPPLVWDTAGTLSRALAATGDDDGAARAAATAKATIEATAAELPDTLREKFLAAEPIRAAISG